jgi:hypothetical protein
MQTRSVRPAASPSLERPTRYGKRRKAVPSQMIIVPCRGYAARHRTSAKLGR